mmetsp:Transcript_25206/g.53592  ORF Transcript_25206/g.53592 Transcript_25206/m.53592 type:complete len:170 (+) Transcript_25206:167-676(+)|eukprot:CAMPEP_0168169812 /NCGR_PEP_ID=MMETSP0139_2-20121125/3838_1 /TAXON_ID=44445 /ORGANISM="Pseudo-nitzschia australis, Strain 10249 10 AB" /LENGTH=169 /DNA_ID=CAMNT_0008087257 /DNA_START=70 /DNA_END=579 /DNA_ORIENTATION=-
MASPSPSIRSFLVTLVPLIIAFANNGIAVAHSDIYGQELAPCSQPGMALTGFTRDGTCADLIDDEGSHHICIDLSSTEGGDFCEVTGQPDWCSSSMECDGDAMNVCPVQNWCVCQWAFASYIEDAGGCENIQGIVCDAINEEAIIAYRTSADESHKEALNCITQRCGLH